MTDQLDGLARGFVGAIGLGSVADGSCWQSIDVSFSRAPKTFDNDFPDFLTLQQRNNDFSDESVGEDTWTACAMTDRVSGCFRCVVPCPPEGVRFRLSGESRGAEQPLSDIFQLAA